MNNLYKELSTIFINGKEKYITPKQVIKNPYVSPNDFCKIINANLLYPIIIYDDIIVFATDKEMLDNLLKELKEDKN